MQLVLVRHGESEWNRLNLFTGWQDVDLSDRGRMEAAECGRTLVAGGFDFDVCYTSYLKRAIDTLNAILAEMDREWLPVTKSWKLNERHYGALQGLNKAETAKKYGEEQVRVWRRSYAVPPPTLEEGDSRNPRMQNQYRNTDKFLLPLSESLKCTVERVVPYYRSEVEKDVAAGKRVLIVSHGNTMRALVKYLEAVPDAAIVDVNIPTGVPLVYDLGPDLAVRSRRYLGDQKEIARRTANAEAIGVHAGR